MKLFRVDYLSQRLDGERISCIPNEDKDAAERLRERINRGEPWRDAIIVEFETGADVFHTPSVCLKCGTPKVYDLFKGEYCSRCNDWC